MLKDQQTKRYENRRKLLLDRSQHIDFKKIPVDSVQFVGNQPQVPVKKDPDQTSEIPSGPPGTAVPAATVVGQVDEDEDELDADNLGLIGAKKPTSKTKVRAVKRTKAEMLEDEVRKVRDEWAACVNSLGQFPDQPRNSEVGRIDRMCQRKSKEFKDSLDFEAAAEMSKVAAELDALRKALKPAQGYCSGTNQTRKKLCQS